MKKILISCCLLASVFTYAYDFAFQCKYKSGVKPYEISKITLYTFADKSIVFQFKMGSEVAIERYNLADSGNYLDVFEILMPNYYRNYERGPITRFLVPPQLLMGKDAVISTIFEYRGVEYTCKRDDRV